MKLGSASVDNNFSDLDYPGETSFNFLFTPEKIMVLQSAVSRSNVVPATIKQKFMLGQQLVILGKRPFFCLNESMVSS